MNHHILQDSIGLQKEVKSLLGAIRKGKESGSMMGHSSKGSIKKWSRHEDSKEIEQVMMKQPAKCWKCRGHHLRRDCPMREHKNGSSHKVPRIWDQLEAENQQEKSMEAEGLGLECSKQMIERGTDLQNFEILDVQIVYVFLCIGTPRTMLFQGRGDCDVLGFDPGYIKRYMMYIL